MIRKSPANTGVFVEYIQHLELHDGLPEEWIRVALTAWDYRAVRRILGTLRGDHADRAATTVARWRVLETSEWTPGTAADRDYYQLMRNPDSSVINHLVTWHLLYHPWVVAAIMDREPLLVEHLRNKMSESAANNNTAMLIGRVLPDLVLETAKQSDCFGLIMMREIELNPEHLVESFPVSHSFADDLKRRTVEITSTEGTLQLHEDDPLLMYAKWWHTSREWSLFATHYTKQVLHYRDCRIPYHFGLEAEF